MIKNPEFDLCVIGGGAAGLVVAAGGASLGAKVALVERHALGGDCLHYGCVPSKTLLHSARVAQTMRNASRYGIEASTPEIDITNVMQRVRDVIKTIEVHDSPERFRGLGIEVIFGAGQFSAPDIFSVDGRSITAKHFVIATGSRPAIPPVEGLDKVPYLTNESIFSITGPIPELIVMGGGPIGVEMAQAFCRLGSRVQLIELGNRILPREDSDLADVVSKRLQQEGVQFHLGHGTQSVRHIDGKIELLIKSTDGYEKKIQGSHLLIAIGRQANIQYLGLDIAGVHAKRGHIITDKRLRTSNKHIYACGDVVGPYQFTHMAEHHAGIVLRNTLFHIPAKIEERVIPWCTFTDPELARVGISETAAQQQGLRHKVYTFPFKDIDRAQAEGETEGLAKVITDPKGRLLGAAIAGPNAGELIHEYVLAISKRLKASDLSKVIHIYPTLAQINRRVADARMKEGLTPNAKKWIKRIFGLRGN